MEIRQTDARDVPQLQALWRQVFDTEGVYTQLFFQHWYDHCVCIGAFQDGELLSALYLLPCQFRVREKTYSMRYVFAVATFPQHRGKGYSSAVVRSAHAYLRETGVDCAALVPAEPSLFQFYDALGYETAFYVHTNTFPVRKGPYPAAQKVSLPDCYALREQCLQQGDGYLSWDRYALQFCQTDNDFEELGQVLSFPTIGRGYAACQLLPDAVHIKELVCEASVKQDYIQAVGNYFGKDRVMVRDFPTDQSQPFGMLVPLSERFKREYRPGRYVLSLPMD